jgi:hypothetical protein
VINKIYELAQQKNKEGLMIHATRIYEHGVYNNGDKGYIVMTLLRGGSLTTLIDYGKKYQQTSEDSVKPIFKDIVNYIALCNSNGIAHCDLKPDNVILDEVLLEDGTTQRNTYVIDLGLASYIKNGYIKGKGGTFWYVPPEVLIKVEGGRTASYTPYDVWSIGVMLIELLCENPYSAAPDQRFWEVLNNLVYTSKSELLQDLLGKIFKRDANERIGITELVAHPWFTTPTPVEEAVPVDSNYSGYGKQVRHMRGTLYVYRGHFKNGMKWGDGNIQFLTDDGRLLDEYNGLWENDTRHGKGIMNYGSSTYNGLWENGKRQGQGIMKYGDGGIYNGLWENGKRQGQGNMKYGDGGIYNGLWENGKRQGQGNMKYGDGGIYNGLWENGKRQGQGIIEDSGNSYSGEWDADNMQGYGTLISVVSAAEPGRTFGEYTQAVQNATKTKFVGIFDKGYETGLGSFQIGDITYTGLWLKGNLSKGVAKDHNNIYNGSFVMERYINVDVPMLASGTKTYANGDVYDGSWSDNNKNGKGIMTYANRDVYDGSWLDNKHELGVMTYANGDVYDGSWLDNKHELGVMTYANGDVYDGSWSDNNKDGRGKMTYANSDVYDGFWSADKMHGSGSMTDFDTGITKTVTCDKGNCNENILSRMANCVAGVCRPPGYPDEHKRYRPE